MVARIVEVAERIVVVVERKVVVLVFENIGVAVVVVVVHIAVDMTSLVAEVDIDTA